MSESIENELDELVDAINNREAERARSLINSIGRRYDEQSAEEKKRIRQATILRGDNEDQQLDQIVSDSAITEMKRGAFLIRAVSAVLEIEQGSTPDDNFRDAVSEVKQADENLQQSERSVESVIEESTIPPSVELVRLSFQTPTIQVGQSTQLEVTLANIGDQSAEGIESTLELDDSAGVSTSADAPDSLNGGEETQLVYEIEAIETGDHRARFEVTSENGGSDLDSTTLTVEPNEQVNDPEEDDSETPEDDPQEIPGFGITTGVAALGGAGYLLKRRLEDDSDSSE
jgi:PGF-CTERM protein